MKKIYILCVLLATFACKQQKSQNQENQTPKDTSNTTTTAQEMVDSTLKKLVDNAPAKGAVLIYDQKQNRYFSNDFNWAKRGQLPASTFKIPNSLIMLETGTVKNDSTLITWDGKKRYLKVWEQDMIFRNAFHLSCLPCYQEMTRKVGEITMQTWVKKFNYGNMVFDTTNYDKFWVAGESKITQFEQIDFLQRFQASKLPISARTDEIAKRMMIKEKTEVYTLRAKTGLSEVEKKLNGWYVGYVEKGDNVYFFATNLEPEKGLSSKKFIKLRIDLTMEALKQKGIL